MTFSGRRAFVALMLLALAIVSDRTMTEGTVERSTPRALAAQLTTTTPSTSTSTTTATTTTTTTTIPVFPLTGRSAPDAGALNRPAVTVKIDNASAARPQAGVEQADVVYEEFTEGITRWVVVFHSTDAEVVGPVRSVRPADPSIVTPLGGVLAFSGGSPAAVELATSSPLTIVTENDTDVMYRRPGRAAPHNLYTSSAAVRSKAPPDAPPPPKFADFLTADGQFGGAGATAVTHVSVVPAPFVTADYDWDGASRTWKRSTDGAPHLSEAGGQIAPTNVVLQFTPYLTFAADAKVQYPEVVGTGDAWILSGGLLVKGTWSKPSAAEPTSFKDAAGAPVALEPGQTWVHLVAPDSSVATE